MANACSIHVRGVVQGVGFRPFVFRLAHANTLAGWVLNGEDGIEIYVEGAQPAIETFVQSLRTQPPPSASITEIDVKPAEPAGLTQFTIQESHWHARPTVRISPDLPVCDDCLNELFDPADCHHKYPYINCTNCGPRYSVVTALPYDRTNTTMKDWPLDAYCTAEYNEPGNRRFHAQPVACPACGPHYYFRAGDEVEQGDEASITKAADYLRAGKIVAIKGIGGYHLACDARNVEAVLALRERKYRKKKPFALMAKNLGVARSLVKLSVEAETLLTSAARPIVLAPAKVDLRGVAPENYDLGVMVPYTPLHHLLFASRAPEVLVMTSANRSNEPIAYEDEDAVKRLSGIADGFLIGERPIARRIDDSVARAGVFGPVVLRRARGYAPSAVATLPVLADFAANFPMHRPILAVGADLKNTITLVVKGQAFVSQHIGDLDDYQSFRAFQKTIHDLVSMYEVRWDDVLVVRDRHPQYVSTTHANTLPAPKKMAVQHHCAHLASVLAERGTWDKRVLGVTLDGTGYGDDGTIWGGEIFIGSVAEGFERIAQLRRAMLPGGDAAAQHPVQAAAGFLAQIDGLPDLAAPPFRFPVRYQNALQLVYKGLRTFTTTSMGRLFDAAAALLGFTRPVSFEGEAAMWLEHLARTTSSAEPYPLPLMGTELDFRPLLEGVVKDRLRGRSPNEIARAFQLGVARGLCNAIKSLCRDREIHTVVLSGGVFQNEVLLEDMKSWLEHGALQIWTNHAVPPNDGGISLGQAALAAFSTT